jgi:lysophospholipase L1-like esterase
MLNRLILAVLLLPTLVGAQPETPTVPPKATNPAASVAPRTDAGWVKRNDAFNARAKQGHEQGDIGIVFIGDSITEGWEGAGKEVWAKSYAPRHAVNLGIGGDQTQHVLYRLEHGNLDGLAHPAKGSAPKLAVIMIGTNNTGSHSVAQIAAGIAAVVEATHQKLPDAKILLLAVFPRSEKQTDPIRAKINAVNTQAAKLTDKPYVTYLDIGDKLLQSDGTLSKEIMPDLLHLSPKGYQIWADAIEPTVRELLSEPAMPAAPK